MIIPKRLCIYYGFPDLVNGSTTINEAISVFQDYDLIVFGDGLQENSHPSHNSVIQIITGLPNSQVFGYIDCRLGLNNLKNKINKWKNMYIAGIFCDQYGYDNGITRNKQNNIVNYIHDQGLIAFVDPWDPDDAFGSMQISTYNSNGIPPVLNSNDWYLAQSYVIINGTYSSTTDWKTKSNKMTNYKNIFGTKMACITTYDTSPYDQTKADFSYFSCAIYGFDAWGFGEYNYSATSALLPYRSRKEIYGTTFIEGIIDQDPIYTRKTNIGIKLDTVNHIASFVLD